MFSDFFFSENRALCEVMWKTVQPDRPKMTIWRMRFADTHSEYVMLVTFPLQQRSAMLRYTYIDCLIIY